MQNIAVCMCTWREVRNFAWHWNKLYHGNNFNHWKLSDL